MLVYGYKGKKCPTSTTYWGSQKNLLALNNYNSDLFNRCSSWEEQSKFLRHVHLSYSTLCKFNNVLVNTYYIDDNFISSINFVKSYLSDNTDILTSIDYKCREIYEHLGIWYKRLIANPNCLDEIKWQVAKSMKFYENQGIFHIASINLKQNYFDFVV